MLTRWLGRRIGRTAVKRRNGRAAEQERWSNTIQHENDEQAGIELIIIEGYIERTR